AHQQVGLLGVLGATLGLLELLERLLLVAGIQQRHAVQEALVQVRGRSLNAAAVFIELELLLLFAQLVGLGLVCRCLGRVFLCFRCAQLDHAVEVHGLVLRRLVADVVGAGVQLQESVQAVGGFVVLAALGQHFRDVQDGAAVKRVGLQLLLFGFKQRHRVFLGDVALAHLFQQVSLVAVLDQVVRALGRADLGVVGLGRQLFLQGLQLLVVGRQAGGARQHIVG